MSGRKNVLPPYPVLPSTAVSGTTVYPSPSTNISLLDNISYMVQVVSGTPSGTFQVQVSHDGVLWQPLTLAAVPTITAGVLTNVPISVITCPFPLIRLSYTNSSGTGNISATVAGKQS